ncbi:MAG: hypothetical protein IPF54_21575 [Draconibacterium sp.]|nr:hypothetical protein [Draconibacterium sp.]
MTKIGDRWRDFAVIAGRICGRNSPTENISVIRETLRNCRTEKETIQNP